MTNNDVENDHEKSMMAGCRGGQRFAGRLHDVEKIPARIGCWKIYLTTFPALLYGHFSRARWEALQIPTSGCRSVRRRGSNQCERLAFFEIFHSRFIS
ncbi:hypothetical protein [Burkholderia gladioli]|uniref:hypothetical protein n=1 Tax=Burkholderia gladioli TaxID=28095 RepID=UPI0034DAC663